MPEAAIREQLARILASDLFVRATRLRGFLEFVVEQTLAGREEQIKESVVGSEVYGREAGYDPRADAVVRVEATRSARNWWSITTARDRRTTLSLRSRRAAMTRVSHPASDRRCLARCRGSGS